MRVPFPGGRGNCQAAFAIFRVRLHLIPVLQEVARQLFRLQPSVGAPGILDDVSGHPEQLTPQVDILVRGLQMVPARQAAVGGHEDVGPKFKVDKDRSPARLLVEDLI